MFDKNFKNNAVTSVDMKRLRQNKNVYLAVGHAKGQYVLYEVRGLPLSTSKNYQVPNPTTISFKHIKTIADMHVTNLVNIKFVGDPHSDVLNVITCDTEGVAYQSTYTDGLLSWNVQK